MTREEAINAIKEHIDTYPIIVEIEALEMAIKALEQEPSITSQPKIGHWIKQTLSVKPFGEDTVLCDQCAFMTDKDSMYNYCPNCGARMKGGAE